MNPSNPCCQAEQAGTQRIENMLQLGFFTRRTMEQMNSEGAGRELRDLAQQLRGWALSVGRLAARQLEVVEVVRDGVRRSRPARYAVGRGPMDAGLESRRDTTTPR